MIDPAKTAFVIPARGGSKRIPGKNLIPFGGKALIDHSISYAQKHQQLARHLLVTTDSPEIKAHCENQNVMVIDRPADLASDTATTVSALKHLVQAAPMDLEWIILLQATNPLRPEGLIEDAIETINAQQGDSLMCVSTFDKKLGKLKDGKFEPYNYQLGQRSQDMEPLYRENGLLYVSHTDLLKQAMLLGPKQTILICDHPFADADIDSQEDLNFAEFLLKTYA
ncbi:cytidylyltransferase domain-containing protein [Gilvibacter sp.]|uniref:acylneuraminate cytidylyltransferase family protein n=1 Tax=Gilvibacter sp. TaxID=2729997 RepID=UPI003F4A80A1